MAFPVINSIVVSPSQVNPGGSFVVTINASDPDAATYTFQGKAKDSSGNESVASAVVVVSDPLTFDLVLPAGFSKTVRAGQPNVFDCVAP